MPTRRRLQGVEASSAPESDDVLTVDDVVVHLGRVPILHGVTFSVGTEPVAMVGRNGMGKTTLAQTIVGILRVTSGSITFGGEELESRRVHQIARAGIGYVPQGRRIFPSLTPEEHLRIVPARRRLTWTLDALYDLFPPLAARRRVDAGRLSGGEQQMLAIARALRTDPEMLVMDEPSEGLAPSITEEIARRLKTLCAEGLGLFLIEQNLDFAAELCDQTLIMVNGTVVAQLTSQQLLFDEQAQRTYLGVT